MHVLSSKLKPAVVAAITPISHAALRVGLTPNAVSVAGALGVIVSALFFYPRGDLFIGTLVISLCALSDLFDGTMARLTNTSGTSWGAFLDSTLDRLSDGAILIGLALYFHRENSSLVYPTLLTLMVGFLIPYIRAKAESLQIECRVGIAERTERLIVILVAAGLSGLGVPYVMALSLWALVVLGVITIGQRVQVVRQAVR